MLTESHFWSKYNLVMICIFVLKYCFFQFINILFRIFASTSMSDIGLEFSMSMSDLGVKFSFLLLFARVSVAWRYLVLKCVLKPSGPGVFIVEKLLIIDFISLVVGYSYFLFSCISFNKLYFSRNLPISFQF